MKIEIGTFKGDPESVDRFFNKKIEISADDMCHATADIMTTGISSELMNDNKMLTLLIPIVTNEVFKALEKIVEQRKK